jgi:hypothetical protein
MRDLQRNRVGGFHVRIGWREDERGISNSGLHESLGIG